MARSRPAPISLRRSLSVVRREPAWLPLELVAFRRQRSEEPESTSCCNGFPLSRRAVRGIEIGCYTATLFNRKCRRRPDLLSREEPSPPFRALQGGEGGAAARQRRGG